MNDKRNTPKIETREVSWAHKVIGLPPVPVMWQSHGEFGDVHIYGDPQNSPERSMQSLLQKSQRMEILSKILVGVLKEKIKL